MKPKKSTHIGLVFQIRAEEGGQKSAGGAGQDGVGSDDGIQLLIEGLFQVQALGDALLDEDGVLDQLLDVVGAGDAGELLGGIQFATQQTLGLQIMQLLLGGGEGGGHLLGQDVVQHHLVAHRGEQHGPGATNQTAATGSI